MQKYALTNESTFIANLLIRNDNYSYRIFKQSQKNYNYIEFLSLYKTLNQKHS